MGKTQRKRKREEEQEKKREDERENESGKRDRATKMEGRLYGAARGEEPLSDESRRVASERITRDTRFIVTATLASREIHSIARFTGPDLAERRNRRRIERHSASVIAVITTE